MRGNVLASFYHSLSEQGIEKSSIIVMSIDELESSFYFQQSGEVLISLPVGYENIRQRYFKHTPPTPDEIEFAINDIEDEIERVVAKMPVEYSLYTGDVFIKHLASLCFVEESEAMSLERGQLERLFGQYSEIAVGRPARVDEPDISTRFFAQLLIFREYMHHLKYTSVNIVTLR